MCQSRSYLISHRKYYLHFTDGKTETQEGSQRGSKMQVHCRYPASCTSIPIRNSDSEKAGDVLRSAARGGPEGKELEVF